jgi:hypothetical protein
LLLKKYEAGEFNEEAAVAASLEEYEAQIAALGRKVGQLTMENDLLKKDAAELSVEARRVVVDRCLASGLSRAQGCRLMGLALSTSYYRPRGRLGPTRPLSGRGSRRFVIATARMATHA